MNARALIRKIMIGSAVYFCAYLLYFYTNHYPVFSPRQLPYSWLDQMIPFWEWAVLIYVSEYLYFTVVYLMLTPDEAWMNYLKAFFFVQAFSCLIFFFFPTSFPRELFPVSQDSSDFLRAIWTWLRNIDAPTNCFPSLHVSTVLLSAFAYKDRNPKLFRFFFVWGGLIALSTLPTKQHYVVDVVSGLVIAYAGYWFGLRKGKPPAKL